MRGQDLAVCKEWIRIVMCNVTMKEKVFRICLIVYAVLLVLSCNPDEESIHVNSDQYRKETNACLENDDLIWPASNKKGDVTLKGRFKEQVELQKIKDGDWYRYLYKITYDDIEVMHGEWKDRKLSFLCKDTWSTEDSGIKLKKLPWPFRENEYMVFEINHKNNKNLIIGYKKADIAP